MVSHELRCVFVHIPKTAGTSIEQKLGLFDELHRGVQDHSSIRDVMPLPVWRNVALLVAGDDELSRRWSVKQLLRRNHRLANRAPLRQQDKKPRLTEAEFRDYFKFAVVRNPWARTYSWYRNAMRDPVHGYEQMAFAEFVRTAIGTSWALRPQLFWMRAFDGTIPLDRIVRFETLAEEMSEILETLGVEDPELPHLLDGNSDGGAQDYLAAYDEETRDLVARRYREEIALLGYRFGG